MRARVSAHSCGLVTSPHHLLCRNNIQTAPWKPAFSGGPPRRMPSRSSLPHRSLPPALIPLGRTCTCGDMRDSLFADKANARCEMAAATGRQLALSYVRTAGPQPGTHP
eukprot:scaffold277336_cov24-Tisochrysis_lutea.AAC.2